MPQTNDEIRERYLDRAIRELNALAHEIHACAGCPRGALVPVLGSGHPQADIMLIKHSARPSEIEEGVAFYGRSGNALMKSFKRLAIDPLTVYGTLCVKCPLEDPTLADPACVRRLLEEIPISHALAATPGHVQELTPMIDALFVPNIDECLDERSAKQRFWDAFRVLGDWQAAQPPY